MSEAQKQQDHEIIRRSYAQALDNLKINLSNLVSDAHEKAANGVKQLVDHYIGHLRDVVIVQAQELGMYHELEHHISQGSMTEEILQDILFRLKAHRAAVVEQSKKQEAETASS